MKQLFTVTILSILIISCSTSQKVVNTENLVTLDETISQEPTKLLKRKVAIARFSNETQYAKGIFYKKENDPTSKQASDILATKLASTGKFVMLERSDLELINKEQEISGEVISKVGADFLILGSITEFGRKNEGDVNAFSRSKTQTVQAGVSLRLVDVYSGEIIYSEEAKGEAVTSNKTVLGLGERADYDATLSDKAISAAISKLVENIINNCMEQPWRSNFLSNQDGQLIMSGGKEQGITSGHTFNVFEKGKKIKNPQTGMMVELPGKKIGSIIVDAVIDKNLSFVSFTEGSVNKNITDEDLINKYVIKEIK